MIAFVYDTETTGLIENRSRPLAHQSEVIEFYGCLVDFNTGEVMDDFETLIKPRHYPTEDEIKRTKNKNIIPKPLLQDAPMFPEIAPRVRALIEGAPTVVAHNAAFDKDMIDLEFERMGQTLNWPAMLCTIEQTMHLKGFRLSLTNLHKHLFDTDFPEAHRAKNDVQALVRCCIELNKQGLF